MWRFALILLPLPALADSVIATRTIRAHSLLSAEDMTLVAMEIPQALTDIAAAIGQETRVAIYAGKPIKAAQIGPSAIIERNQIVPLSYSAGGLTILTEGRALARGGVGETIEVMNMTSRTKVAGQIGPDGVVRVGPSS
ncbi:MAG: flagellar basal body P-ring formation chaperone FlgA [Erythrobacter sp.]|nr:flagellar basal body P-ring formation chaperone FlgA [Erythrobacter sp.]